MKRWTVYFEIFGKKMKTDVRAKDSFDAMSKVRDKITFHKVEEQPQDTKDIIEDLFDAFKR